MIKIEVVLKNKNGLHMRPAGELMSKVHAHRKINGHDSVDVKIKRGEQMASATSMIEMLMLAATSGTKLEIVLTGPDKEKFLPVIKKFFEEEIHLYDE